MERFAIIPYDLYDDLSNGDITPPMFYAMLFLYKWADWETGIVRKVRAGRMEEASGGGYAARTFQRALQNLHNSGRITSHHIQGSKKWYKVDINNYKALSGALKDTVLRPTDIADWRATDAAQGADEGGEQAVMTTATRRSRGGDDGVEKATVLKSSQKSLQESQKSSQQSSQKSQKSETIAAAKATAAAAVSPTNILSESERVQIEYIHYLINPEMELDETVRIDNVDLLKTVDIPNPVKFANQLFWAYRKSNYSERLNGLPSFLKLYPKIARAYEKYYDQEDYHCGKETPEERMPTLEAVTEVAEKIFTKYQDGGSCQIVDRGDGVMIEAPIPDFTPIPRKDYKKIEVDEL